MFIFSRFALVDGLDYSVYDLELSARITYKIETIRMFIADSTEADRAVIEQCLQNTALGVATVLDMF